MTIWAVVKRLLLSYLRWGHITTLFCCTITFKLVMRRILVALLDMLGIVFLDRRD